LFHACYFTGKRNINQDPQRLNGRGREKILHAIVRTISKDLERGLTRLSALFNKVIKVTESRQTEDELMRDMLASTASFINCTNGVNGKQKRDIAVLKSSLIDLELAA